MRLQEMNVPLRIQKKNIKLHFLNQLQYGLIPKFNVTTTTSHLCCVMLQYMISGFIQFIGDDFFECFGERNSIATHASHAVWSMYELRQGLESIIWLKMQIHVIHMCAHLYEHKNTRSSVFDINHVPKIQSSLFLLSSLYCLRIVLVIFSALIPSVTLKEATSSMTNSFFLSWKLRKR